MVIKAVDRYPRQMRRIAREAKSRFPRGGSFPSTMVKVNTPALQMRITETPRNALLRSAKSVVGDLRSSRPPQQMALPQFNGSAFGDSRQPSAHTITSLKRWSVAGKELPGTKPLRANSVCPHELTEEFLDVSQIKTIHVYDFDNTCEYWPYYFTERT
jgi:hypothetical protein